MTAADAPATLDPADPWGTFQRSAFRLETLPEYRVPQEAGLLERYLSGASIPDDFNVTWHHKIGSWAAAGAVLQRVRVVRPPLTDYERFEFDWGYPGNLAAGEDTRVLDGVVADQLGLPDWDFWFFDDEVVHRMTMQRTAPTSEARRCQTPTQLSSGVTVSWP